MDAILGTVFAVLGISAYALLYRRTDDALHPLAIFAGFWLLIFGFAHLDVARSYDEPYYADPFGVLTYAVVLGALLSFAFGFWLADPGMQRLDRRKIGWRLEHGVAWPRLRALTLGLFVVASLMTAYFVQQAGEIPLFSPRIDTLRTQFKLPLLGYVYDLHYAVALFSAMLVVHSKSRAQKLLWGGLAGLSVFQLMFGGVRVSPMTALAWIIVFLFYRPTRVRVRHMVLAGVVAVTVFTVIEDFRRTMYEVNPSLVNPRIDLSAPATAWAHTAASFKNLQFTLERGVSPLNMGLNSYDLPKTFLPEARTVDDQISYMYGTHNTPTFLSFLYFDFGVGGLLVMPLVYGAMVGFVYRRFRTGANLFWLIVYIDFLLAVVLAFRTHRFLGNALIWFMGIAVLSQLAAGRGVEGGPPPDEADEGAAAEGLGDPAAPGRLGAPA
ncbi:MAG: O-antigen polymerase [Longimicrobiales bacterium]